MMRKRLTLVAGTDVEELERPSGYTANVCQQLTSIDGLLRQASDMLKQVHDEAEVDSEAHLEIRDARRHLNEALYYVNWRDDEEQS